MPLSWIYGAVMWVRNKLFDLGILRQVEFEVPVIGVGNLTVGGTGKTPHTEYIVSHLCGSYNVAVLSRGYKRKTRGFIMANSKSTPDSIGDEPWQIYNKFGMKAKVAVCENRRKGISELLRLYPELDLIVLDDSFQHRWVKPRISVLLMEYGRPVYNDRLLPLGRLRESAHEINRADKVIVTKCPESLSPIDFRIVTKELDLMKFQKLYFSRYVYDDLRPVFPDECRFTVNLGSFSEKDSILLLTGIAHPHYFVRHYRQYPCRKKVEHFSDHHHFTRGDINRIAEKFRDMKGERKVIITTEKDAVRLVHNPYFPQDLKPYIFYQPIRVDFVAGTYEQDNSLETDLISELHLDSSADTADAPDAVWRSGYDSGPDRGIDRALVDDGNAAYVGRESQRYVSGDNTYPSASHTATNTDYRDRTAAEIDDDGAYGPLDGNPHHDNNFNHEDYD